MFCTRTYKLKKIFHFDILITENPCRKPCEFIKSVIITRTSGISGAPCMTYTKRLFTVPIWRMRHLQRAMKELK